MKEPESALVTGSECGDWAHFKAQTLVSKYHFPLKELGLIGERAAFRAEKVQDEQETSSCYQNIRKYQKMTGTCQKNTGSSWRSSLWQGWDNLSIKVNSTNGLKHTE